MSVHSLYLHPVNGDDRPAITPIPEEEVAASVERLIKCAENLKWLKSEQRGALAEYEGLWVGVHDKRIVATGNTQEGVQHKLKELGMGKKGELIEFISSRQESWEQL